MEKAPKDIDLENLANGIKSIDPVCGLHDLHVWTVGEGKTLLSCHVALPSGSSLDETCSAIERISKMLELEFSINHATIQPEVEGLCVLGEPETLSCKMDEPDESKHNH